MIILQMILDMLVGKENQLNIDLDECQYLLMECNVF